MSFRDILTILHRRPFEPFRIVTTDGTHYEIRHPELVMLGTDSLIIGLPAQLSDPVYERTVILSMLHVQRLESPLSASTQA